MRTIRKSFVYHGKMRFVRIHADKLNRGIITSGNRKIRFTMIAGQVYLNEEDVEKYNLGSNLIKGFANGLESLIGFDTDTHYLK